MRRFAAFWARSPFLFRLLATACGALLAAGCALLFVSAGGDARYARQDLAEELASDLATLPAALAEVVVVGDFATLLQTLDRYVARPRVDAVIFHDTSGAVFASQAPRRLDVAPRWFRDVLDYQNISGAADVRVGGRSYGRLEIHLSAQNAAHRAWMRFLAHIGILTLAITLDFIGIWWVLRSGLAPLRRLEHAAAALAGGDFAQRVAPAGGPEIQRLFVAFNDMAAALQKTQRLLARRNAELRRFSEIAAHHLQEPVRRLAVFSQRLAKQTPPDADRNALTSINFITQESARLRNLLRDIELYLAAEQPIGKLALRAVEPIAQAAWRALVERAPGLDAELRVASLPEVMIDERRLHDVFTILFDNAIRYRRPDAPLRVTVSGQSIDGVTRLRIEDNGVGVAPAYHEKIFGVFERLHPDAADVSTGVGLAIIRRIAESTGGRAWVEDATPQGLVVVVELGLG